MPGVFGGWAIKYAEARHGTFFAGKPGSGANTAAARFGVEILMRSWQWAQTKHSISFGTQAGVTFPVLSDPVFFFEDTHSIRPPKHNPIVIFTERHSSIEIPLKTRTRKLFSSYANK